MNEQEPGREPDHEQPEQVAGAALPEAREAEPRAAPRIYVASLSDYNAGNLFGCYVEATEDVETMQEEIDAMLAKSPAAARYGDVAEEWAIHDYEGFGVRHLNEHESLETISRLGDGIITHGEAFAAWAEHVGSDPDELARFEDCFLGEWESIEAFAESMIDDYRIMDDIDKMVPEHIRPYIEIDIEAFARDLHYGGDITPIDKPGGGVWVFGP